MNENDLATSIKAAIKCVEEFLEKNFSDDVKKSAIAGGLSLISSIINIKLYLDKLNIVDDLACLLSAGKKFLTKDVHPLINSSSLNKNDKKSFLQLVCSDANCEASASLTTNEMLKVLSNEKQKIANNTILVSCIQSGIVIAVEFHSLYSVWAEINKANYVIDECKKQLPEINNTIMEMSDKANKLTCLIQEFTKCTDENTKPQIINKIIRINTELSRKINKTRNQINHIKVKIENGIEAIGSQQKQQYGHAISNFAQGLGSTAQLIGLCKIASPSYVVAQSIMAGTFFILGSANVYTAICCNDTLEKFREAFNEIEVLEKLVEEMEKTCEEAEKLVEL